MRAHLLVLALAPMLALAGCAGHPAAGRASGDASHPGAGLASPPAAAGAGAPAGGATRFALNQCLGLYTSFAWPATAGPGEAPKGWDFQVPPNLGSNSNMLLLHCGRVSWGPFERAADILLDVHNRFTAPPACLSAMNHPFVVANLWTSDPALSQYLAASYGIPVQTGRFSTSFDNGSNPVSWTWSWQPAGGAPSSLQYQGVDFNGSSGGFAQRYFWDNGKGVSFIDLNGTVTVGNSGPATSGPTQPVTGTLAAPMLYATKASQYAAGGEDILQSDWTGDVKEYGDRACATPA